MGVRSNSVAWIVALLLCVTSITSTIRSTFTCTKYALQNDSLEYAEIAKTVAPTDTEEFDKMVQIAQNLIDRALPDPTNRTNNFDLSKWESRTDGGLTEQDRKKLADIYGIADSVFEYGLGESTYIAGEVGVRRYAGIDSDAVWVAKAREKSPEHFRFYFADTGATGAWGYPKGGVALPKSTFQYQLMPLFAESRPFDVYMVDGRWRVPCVIASFLHASSRGADHQQTIVLLHDCFIKEHWNNGTGVIPKNLDRPTYRSLDDLLDLVDHSENRLCVYKRKPGTTNAQLYDFWELHYDALH
jgi:hypothetical protein